MSLLVTGHAVRRAKKRVGLSGKATRRILPRVIRYGVRASGRDDALSNYLMATGNAGLDEWEAVAYGCHVYILRQEALVTILPLPKRFVAQVCAAVSRHKAGMKV